ncbi:HNH endonuclease [Frankia sp. AgB1.9]|uniref:HNH endonuclease family protein n=1 Tax=unclassified Frankia TaxID=2632575 RepID=UPI001934B333|nr:MULTISPECIES: HNH endonuclease family protein [unclassified Frankia]MBL7489909.1 HNH endonuclease [Frankia sp. AgW1.1]MBL7549839.1 HNH endonuclease [Frankia sp. AgB1.9]MBL7622804.1 HNH endonuclease [Frankia sp. AgB1.8]
MGTWVAGRLAAVVAAAATVAVLASGCNAVSTALNDASTASPSGALPSGFAANGSDVGADGSALAALGTLKIAPLATSPKYDRDAFGTAWKDVDHNGCDTRNDVLRRDLHSVTVRTTDNCIVLTGELNDPYTNRIIRFNRGKDSAAVQIDHVVPLGDAWRTGAYAFPQAEREAIANDPENLLAVDGPTNIKKSDSDASEWLPPASGYKCTYVARQIGIKARYHLWVTQAEADAMRTVLSSCASQPELGG